MANPIVLYDNALSGAGLAASSTAAGDYNVANLTDWRPYTWWKPTALPATVTRDYGAAKACDYALIYGHDLHTQGATVEIRASTDNFGASDDLIASSTPTTGDPVLLTFNSASYRYWRIRITGTTMPSLAIAAIGAALTMPTAMESGFDPIGRKPMGRFNRSSNGHPLGVVNEFEEWTQNLSFRLLTWTWLRDTFLAAWRTHLRDNPFAIAWEPALYPKETYLVKATGGFQAPHKPGSLTDLTIEVTGVVT